MAENNYLTVEQAAELLQVHFRTIYSWVKNGTIPAIKIGRSWRIKKSDIDNLFENASSEIK